LESLYGPPHTTLDRQQGTGSCGTLAGVTAQNDSEPPPGSTRSSLAVSHRAVDGALWALSGVLLLAIVVLSLGPKGPPQPFSLADKMWHALAYAALTGCLLLAAVWRPGRGSGWLAGRAWAIAVGAALLGTILEVAQAFDPFADRHGDLGDWLANTVGVLAAFGAWRVLRRWMSGRGASRA
jgi:VanZ family protein